MNANAYKIESGQKASVTVDASTDRVALPKTGSYRMYLVRATGTIRVRLGDDTVTADSDDLLLLDGETVVLARNGATHISALGAASGDAVEAYPVEPVR